MSKACDQENLLLILACAPDRDEGRAVGGLLYGPRLAGSERRETEVITRHGLPSGSAKKRSACKYRVDRVGQFLGCVGF
jgi:hypothetical protein